MKAVVFTVISAAAASLVLADQHHHAGFSLRARAVHKRRLDIQRRKTLGWGDSTSAPSTVAKGSDSSACTCWHTVADGEVCLGLIDKSSKGFTLQKFFDLNPSLNNDCSNLITGVSYCVDDGVNTYPNGTTADAGSSSNNVKASGSAAKLAVAAKATSASASASASASGVSDQNEDEDEDDDESDDEEEEDACSSAADVEGAASSTSAKYTANNYNKAPAKSAPAPAQTWTSSSSSEWTAPTTSTSEWVAPTTSTSEWTAPTTSSAAAQASSGSDQGFIGTATFYYQHNTAGACGTVSQDTGYVAALYTSLYGDGSNCGRKIKLTNTDNGNTVEVTAMDECPSCTDDSHIDLSVAAYDALGLQSAGVLPVKWEFIS